MKFVKFLVLGLVLLNLKCVFADDFFVTEVKSSGKNSFSYNSFSLKDSSKIRIIGVGKHYKDKMLDYAWIFNKDTKKLVWVMELNNYKNYGKEFLDYETSLKLPAGNYKVCYASFKNAFWLPSNFLLFKFNSDETHDFDESMMEIEKERKKIEKRKEKLEQKRKKLERKSSSKNDDFDEVIQEFEEEMNELDNEMAELGKEIEELTKAKGFNIKENDNSKPEDDFGLSKVWNFDEFIEDIFKEFKDKDYQDSKDSKKNGKLKISVFIDENGKNNIVSYYPYNSLQKDFISITGLRDNQFIEKSFSLGKPTKVKIYAIGEFGMNEKADYGWIVNNRTRDCVWQMERLNTRHFGGSPKNRGYSGEILFTEGNYSVYFQTDDSHSTDNWNSLPPFDTDNWGITLSADTLSIKNIADFTPQNLVPLIDLSGLGNDEAVTKSFSLNNQTKLWIYAVGEITKKQHDYGYITNAITKQIVWEMNYKNTKYAGGSDKNRYFDGIIELPKGEYLANFVTDDSHSYKDGWNSTMPMTPKSWGMKIYPTENFDTKSFKILTEQKSENTLAEILKVSDDAILSQKFTLKKETKVLIFCVGEGQSGEMYDYGWIKNELGNTVWEMSYKKTSWAGGSKKNRYTSEEKTLASGTYTLYYKSDDSHSYKNWNDSPPNDQNSWGISVSIIK